MMPSHVESFSWSNLTLFLFHSLHFFHYISLIRYKLRATSLLKQKKMYMNQQNSLSNQSFGLEQMKFTTEQMQTNMDTVKAMKSAHKTLTKQYKKMNVDKVEQLQDSMFDLMADAEEVQEILSRTYDVEGDMDDDELLAELDGLDDELDVNYLDDLEKLDVPSNPTSVEKDDFKQLEEEMLR